MYASSRIASLHSALAVLLLVCALVLGGGQGGLGDMLAQLLALALIGVSWWRHAHDPEAGWTRLAWLALLPLAVPLLQLLPLPEALWTWPSARGQIGSELAAAGVSPPPARWSLTPLATERALFWMLPAVALYLAVQQMDDQRRMRLLKVLLVVATASVLLGLAQLAGGVDSPLRPYRITNPTVAVGFFANRNHYASLLAAMLPLVIVGLVVWNQGREGNGAAKVLGVMAGIAGVALLILGLALARSRAGLALGMLAVLLSLPLALKVGRLRRGTLQVLALALLVGVVLSVQFALVGVLRLLEADPLEDSRFRVTEVGLQVAREHAPLGTGLGGFRAAYETAEGLPASSQYVNHAHNDFAEIWLETGWLGAVPAAIVLGAFAYAGVRVLRRFVQPRDRRANALRAAAWLSLFLVILHSLVDYPLRTTAMLAVAGLLAAVLTPSRNESASPA